MTTERFQWLTGVAARQYGLVTGGQATRVGVERGELEQFSMRALLFELDHDVYQLTSSPLAPRFAYPYATWLALEPATYGFERDDQAVLSHGSAARLHGIGAVSAPATTFTVGAQPSVVPRAVELHHRVPTDVTRVGPLLVTTPHRTIVDLVVSGADHIEVRGALSDAVRRDLVDLLAVYDELRPLADQYEFPADGPEFAGYFLPDVDAGELSARNLRGLACIVVAGRVADTELILGPALAAVPGGDRVSAALVRSLAAEIVGRTERV